MGLSFYDSDQNLFASGSFRPIVDGHLGGTHEEKIYLRNDDATKYFVGVSLVLISAGYSGAGENGYSGIGFKFMYGERRPTEAEWDLVPSGEPILLPDIGSSSAGDTYTFHPIWVRVFVPGNSSANVIEDFTFRVYHYPKVVGA